MEPTDAEGGLPSDRGASRTALGAARLRAAHLLIDDPPPIFDDPLASRLLAPEVAAAIREHAERLRTPASLTLRCDVVVRSRYAEDRLAEAVRRGVRQYAILGAGLDTFACRQPAWASALRIVEVDHPASQADKLARLSRAGIAPPPNVWYAAADLEVDDLEPVFRASGFDAAEPVFVACLGVLVYLSERAAGAIFDTAARLPGGSEMAFTFSRPDASTAGPPRPGSAAARVAAAGEPWRTRFDPEALRARLEASGFGWTEFLFAEDIRQRYLRGRDDGLRASPRMVLAAAKV